ncbi:hypothetical protein [Cryobacterium cryoconiti]|uniref:DUF4190 domain-containing protein n=1 Tax=Cryobacterium cryoconiti TaxID=1259239 RepID=A0A4Y8JZA4_9MICO|nr:hypothetical protein [Cryobacterium cryoconiti]TFD34207.1 hypothetical protein E3T49_00605 [Cryobacterium cryoconiti]
MTMQTDSGNAAGYPGQTPTPATTGNGMAIAGLVLAFLPLLNVAGLVLSIIGRRAARRENRSAVIGTLGIVISCVSIVFNLIMVVIAIVLLSYTVAQCGDLGPGTHLVDGVTYTCG